MTDQTLSPQIAATSSAPRSADAASPIELRFLRGLICWLQRRRDRAHLAELPDYLLEDIGLTRADVPRLPPSRDTLR